MVGPSLQVRDLAAWELELEFSLELGDLRFGVSVVPYAQMGPVSASSIIHHPAPLPLRFPFSRAVLPGRLAPMINRLWTDHCRLRAWLWRWGWFGCLAAWLGSPLVAQSPSAAPSLYRALFVVDTSYSMSRVAKAARQEVYDLILNGVQGQLRTGDLYTVWTFNSDVYTNRFSPKAWDGKLNQALASGALRFLESQKCEKQTRLDRLWPELGKVSLASEILTVFLITDGDDRFEGTPFDEPVNALFKQHYREMRRAKRPFVTTMVALRGRFVAYTVSPAGEPIALGDLAQQIAQVAPPAEPTKSPATELPPRVAEAPAAQTNTLASIPEPSIPPVAAPIETPVAVTNKPPASSQPPSPPLKTAIETVTSNLVQKPPAVTPAPIAQKEAQPPPHIPPSAGPPPAPEQRHAESLPLEQGKTSSTSNILSDEIDLAKLLTKPGLDVLRTNNTPPVVESAPPTSTMMATDTLRNILSSNRFQSGRLEARPEGRTPAAITNPAPIGRITKQSPKAAESKVVNSPALPALPLVPAKTSRAVAPKPPLAQPALVDSFMTGHGPLILGASLLVAGFSLGYWFIRRFRTPRRASFISRSIERELK